jgi:hypothetical protein
VESENAVRERKFENREDEEFVSSLQDRYGPLMGGEYLVKALGYSNSKALRQARLQNRLGVRVFSVPNRRGTFALTRDVAAWLSKIRKEEPIY